VEEIRTTRGADEMAASNTATQAAGSLTGRILHLEAQARAHEEQREVQMRAFAYQQTLILDLLQGLPNRIGDVASNAAAPPIPPPHRRAHCPVPPPVQPAVQQAGHEEEKDEETTPHRQAPLPHQAPPPTAHHPPPPRVTQDEEPPPLPPPPSPPPSAPENNPLPCPTALNPVQVAYRS
jgi:hypothetical protein